MAKGAEKTEEDFVEGALRDLPEELRKKLKKKRKKRASPVEAWVERERADVAEREKIKQFA